MDKDARKKPRMGKREFVVLVLIVMISIIFLNQIFLVRPSAQRASCAGNLKQFSLIFKMYINESDGGFYPPMQLKDCNGKPLGWSKTMDVASLLPEYQTDLSLKLECPANPHIDRNKHDEADSNWYDVNPVNPNFPLDNPFAMNDVVEPCELMENSYTYYSHLLIVEDETEDITQESLESFRQEFAKLYNSVLNGELSLLKNDINVSRTTVLFQNSEEGRVKEEFKEWEKKSRSVYRLREGMGLKLYTLFSGTYGRYQSDIVVMHERIPKDMNFFHSGNGVNVLFLDGYVEFVKNDEAGEFVFGDVGEIVQRRW